MLNSVFIIFLHNVCKINVYTCQCYLFYQDSNLESVIKNLLVFDCFTNIYLYYIQNGSAQLLSSVAQLLLKLEF